MKRLFIAIIITYMLLAISAPGCSSSQENGGIQSQGDSEPAPPYTLELSFPNGAPALNQVSELKVVAIHMTRAMNDVRINLVLPEGFELISGNLTWSASSLPYGETEVINAQIKAKKTGNWTIEARLNEAQNTSYPEGGARHPIYVSVYEDSAEWGITPPWYGNDGHPVGVTPLAGPAMTIKEFSISHAPVLNEPADITLTLSSPDDMPDITSRIILPEGATLVDGNLEWHGDLKAGVPVTTSAQIVFIKIGNWRIDGGLWQWVGKENSWGVYDSIYLIIGIDQSSFGQPPEPPVEDLPTPPAIPAD